MIAHSTLRVPGRVQGVTLLLLTSLAVMGIIVLVPVVPLLMQHFAGIPQVQYLVLGGVLTMPALAGALFSPLAGLLADTVGRRRLLLISIVGYAFIGAAPCILDNIYAIIASRVGVGICEAAIMTSSTTLIGDYFQGAAREKWLANQTAVASVSSLFLIAMGGVLGGVFGWRGPFGIYLIALLFAFAVWRVTWEPSAKSSMTAASDDRAGAGLPIDATELDGVAKTFPLARVLGICAITLFASVMFYTIPTQASLALSQLGVHDPARLGLFTAIACLGVPLGTFVFRVVARRPVSVLLAAEFFIMGIGFALMGVSRNPTEFIVAASINQIGCGMILPTLLIWATRGLQFQVRGRGTGMWQAAFALGQFMSGLIVTLIDEKVGGLPQAFVVLCVGNVVIALFCIFARVLPRGVMGPATRVQ